ncbi:hypothetical protein A994_08881 [Methanobacterium formicicum DSM 3637]|uniref:Right handed beta helix domain-containing protein n=1 Tax=Methanobacterium formicicum (strain DSM 3637 / PP1) TaxID=1204725 RepID=K2RAC5_METFP|nr:hypothetical protein A994_08881 [Methanobacterium formicicum DSM 3637]
MCNLFNKHKGGETIIKQAITYRKLIPLILITLTVLFCASTVSAADEAIYVNGSYGNDSWDGQTWQTAKLTIQNATGTVSPNGVVTIADGVYSGTGNTNITINQNMTIQGLNLAGTIINGTNNTVIFSIKPGITLILSNLELTNGNHYHGGAIYNQGNLYLDNCNVTNSTSSYGGGIYNSGTLAVVDSTITGNTLNFGYLNGGGGIYNDGGTLTVINSIISNNTGLAMWGGGGILNNGNLTVIDSTITDNTLSNYSGAGIYNIDTCIVTGSVIQNNSAAYGGGIYNTGTLTVIGSYFGYNTATTGDGGAIYNDGTLTVTGSIFTNNTGGLNGGALYNKDNMTVTDSHFTNNTATSNNGGAIYNYKNLIVNGSTFTNNTANYEGGAIFNRDTATVTDSTFTSNNATTNGGAIYTSDSLTVAGSNFSNNTAENGGAIYNDYHLIVNNSTFFRNSAHEGGAISSEGDITMHFNRIVENSAQYGSAIYNHKGDVNATDNWWGSNDPEFETLIDGDVNYSPWLYLTFSAEPLSIPQGSSSTLTASFNQDTDGFTINPLDPVNGHIPDGSPVTFTTTLGNVGSKSVEKYTINGIATATLRADEAAGSAVVGVLADSQPLTSTVTITPGSTDTNTSTNQTGTSNSVNAASTTNTVGMQSTGAPIVPLAIGILSVLGGLAATRKKQ